MSENAGIFGEYVEFERSSRTAKGPFAAEIGVLKWLLNNLDRPKEVKKLPQTHPQSDANKALRQGKNQSSDYQSPAVTGYQSLLIHQCHFSCKKPLNYRHFR